MRKIKNALNNISVRPFRKEEKIENYIEKIKSFFMENWIGILIGIVSLIISFIIVGTKEKAKDCNCPLCEYEEKSDLKKLIKVDVKGAVKEPKVYILEEDATVEDAIKMAGGLIDGGITSNINLSKKLKDEMVVYVFTQAELDKENSQNEIVCEVPKCECETIKVSGDTIINKNDSNKAESSNGLISINDASLEDLMTLDGIGNSKALAIINYRNENGPFKSIEEIKNVSGIGDALYEKIKNKIKV